MKFFCGSTNNVLDRYYQCANFFSCDPVVRISSDCPFIDPIIIDKIILKFLKNTFHYVSNNLDKVNNKWQNSTCNFPQGMVVEICKFQTLEKVWKESKKPSEKEHVFPYLQFNSKFTKSNIKNKKIYLLLDVLLIKLKIFPSPKKFGNDLLNQKKLFI